MSHASFRGFTVLCCTLGLWTLALSSRAEGRKWALLIGIKEYDRAEISRLDFAVKDVNGVARTLQQNLGYEASNIRTMTSAIKDPNDSNRPTNDNVIATLERLARSVGPDDTFLFYFTGHGFNRDGQNFLASVNTNPLSVNTLKRSAIPLTDLQETMQGFKAKQIIFVIDACRNDPEKGKGEGDNKLTDAFSKSLVVASRASHAGSSGVLFACSEGERAFEDPSKGQSVFTYYLMEALTGKAGGNNGPLSMSNIVQYVRKQVGAWADEHGKKQTPELLPKEAAQLVMADKLTAAVVPGEQVAISLLDTQAALMITSDPLGATVIVDGTAVGKTPYTLTADLGLDEKKTVRIGLSRGGYVARAFDVELVRGKALSAPSITLTQRNPEKGVQPSRLVKPSLPDKAELVYIPAGEFTMGSEDYPDEKPVHKVSLDGYFIYKTPVTVKQYKQFCAATGKAMPPEPVYEKHFNANWSKEDHPIVNVSWNDATGYCRWLSQQTGRTVTLPTEAQWEKAARGEDGRKFPWGNVFDGSRLQHSTAKLGDAGGTAPVGSFPSGASPYGVLDMAGNVWQWCADYYAEGYYKVSPMSNPTGPANGSARVLRGGSWGNYGEGNFRCAYRGRFAPVNWFTYNGFRCVVSVDSP